MYCLFKNAGFMIYNVMELLSKTQFLKIDSTYFEHILVKCRN